MSSTKTPAPAHRLAARTHLGRLALAASPAALLALAVADPAARGSALLAAHHLDAVLLAPLAVGSALTGIVLAGATPAGFVLLSGMLGDAHADPAAAPPGVLLVLVLVAIMNRRTAGSRSPVR